LSPSHVQLSIGRSYVSSHEALSHSHVAWHLHSLNHPFLRTTSSWHRIGPHSAASLLPTTVSPARGLSMGLVRDSLVSSCVTGAQLPVVGFIRRFKVLRLLQLGIPRINREPNEVSSILPLPQCIQVVRQPSTCYEIQVNGTINAGCLFEPNMSARDMSKDQGSDLGPPHQRIHAAQGMYFADRAS
jgi:hypothetical protein